MVLGKLEKCSMQNNELDPYIILLAKNKVEMD